MKGKFYMNVFCIGMWEGGCTRKAGMLHHNVQHVGRGRHMGPVCVCVWCESAYIYVPSFTAQVNHF